MKNLQIVLETMTRCGGNCSGCALNSIERMNTTFDFDSYKEKLLKLKKIFTDLEIKEIESVSLFLGQGDHFLIEDNEIGLFMKELSENIPEEFKEKIVVFITASAIGKFQHIKRKMDVFYEYSIKYKIPFFIQVVFDPKKIKEHQHFENTYMKNILYFKEKCGMTEVTVNIGEDILNSITPNEFHNWIINNKFKHIEINWVMNELTYPMWINIYKQMFSWIKDWLSIYLKDNKYEINFIPFIGRALLKKDKDILDMIEEINQSINENIYIDKNGNLSYGQMGLISNLTPFNQRLKENKNIINANKVISKLMSKKSCMSCEYKSTCSMVGITPWFEFKSKEDINECPWGVKDFLKFYENNIINQNNCLIETKFNKNPVQHKSLMKKLVNNKMFDYFEYKFKRSIE